MIARLVENRQPQLQTQIPSGNDKQEITPLPIRLMEVWRTSTPKMDADRVRFKRSVFGGAVYVVDDEVLDRAFLGG